jgi:tetratricopeptide (TPR) repeat protein
MVGAVFAAGLIGATTNATLQANRANRERVRAESERQHALESEALATNSRKLAEQAVLEAERQRSYAEEQTRAADRRFQQVRQLAGKFLLDFHDSISSLPGSTAARKMVVSTGLQYYDTLVKEAHGNRDLLEEIARGYDRLGDVQGNPYYANLGDAAGSLAAYEKARAIRESVSDPSSAFLLDRIGGAVKRAQVLAVKGEIAPAEDTLREAIALGEGSPLKATYPVRQSVASAYRSSGDVYYRTGDFSRSLDPYNKALQMWTELARENLNPAAEQTGIALAHAKIGETYANLHRPEDALPHVRIAIEINKQLVDADPNSIPRQRNLFMAYSFLSLIFRGNERLAGPGEARATAETAAQLAERMHAADPNNSTALFDVMTGESLVGDWLRGHDDLAAAVAYYRKAVEAAEKFAATGAAALFTYESLIYAHQRLASGLGNSGQLEEALEQCIKAEEYADRAEKLSPGLAEILSRRTDIVNTRAQAYAKRERWLEAIAAYRAAIQIFDDLRKRSPKNDGYLAGQAESRLEMADCYAAAGEQVEAVQVVRAAMEDLGTLASLRPLRSEEQARQTAASAKIALWAAKAAVNR